MAQTMGKHTMTLGQLFPSTRLSADVAEISVRNLLLDSRKVQAGDVFVALPGVQTHGKHFIPAVIRQGAAAILLDAPESEVTYHQSIPVLSVPNLLEQVSLLAAKFYGHPSQTLSVIGVTGTNGKTTCSQWIAQLLACLGDICGVLGTLGYSLLTQSKMKMGNLSDSFCETGMTTPDAICTQAIFSEFERNGANAVAMEVSSHALVQHRVDAIDIDIAVFTNLSQDHLDYHQTMADYGEAKASLFALPGVSAAVLNGDDEFAGTLLDKISEDVDIYSYSIDKPSPLSQKISGHFYFKNIQTSQKGVMAELVSPEGIYTLEANIIGLFNLSNLLAAIVSVWAKGHALVDIVQALPLIKAVSGRMELIANHLDITVVIDYAHTPDALDSALQALKPWATKKLCCVFGCGGDRDKGKRPLMGAIAEKHADRIILTNDNPRSELPADIIQDIAQGLPVGTFQIIEDREFAIAEAIATAEAGDVILIAGKGHEDYQIIGDTRHYFSDQQQARLQLRQREQEGLQ